MQYQTIMYTALFGNYDDLKDHTHSKENSFCFTDRSDLVSNSWTIIPVERRAKSIDERIRLARYIKTHSHIVLPQHTVSIWVDASLQLNENYINLIQYVMNADLATFRYPDIWGTRTCAYEEALACISRGKDAKDVIEKQMDRYKKSQFPINNGLVETSILIRNNSSAVEKFNEYWWDEISNGSRRDQLSFNYCCWHLNMEYALLPGHRLQNPFSKYINHKEILYPGYSFYSNKISK